VAREPARALRRSGGSEIEEQVVDEVPMTIEIGDVARLALFATPTDLDDLVLGILLGEGIAADAGELLGVDSTVQGEGLVLRPRLSADAAARLQARPAHRELRASGSAAARLVAGEAIPARTVAVVEIGHAALVAGMRALALGEGLWKSTGASHAAAWISTAGELLLLREDVGRRNALDKLVGAMARAGIGPGSGFAAVTSRVSHDLVRQAAAAGIGLLAAMSAPTALAVRLADAMGMTLVGFARGDSAALYTHPERVREGTDGDA
jgi:FdhD protein